MGKKHKIEFTLSMYDSKTGELLSDMSIESGEITKVNHKSKEDKYYFPNNKENRNIYRNSLYHNATLDLRNGGKVVTELEGSKLYLYER